MKPYKLAPYAKLIEYQKHFTPGFVQKVIEVDDLEGLRIFAHLSDERLGSLDFLKEYSFLKRLDIAAISENDFNYDFLNQLQNLEHLSLSIDVLNKKSRNSVTLSSLIKLKSFSVGSNQQFQGLENCRDVESLFLGDFQHLDLTSIGCLTNLKSLRIKESTIKDLNGIQSLKLLETAFFGHCKRLRDVKSVNGLRNLIRLTFDGCPKIRTLNSLNQLPSLEMLELIDCKEINTLNFLNYLPKLKNLTFRGTIILDSDLIPAKEITSVFYEHKKHYNIKLDTTEQDEIYKRNMQKLKELRYPK